jgi:hypothetical protein
VSFESLADPWRKKYRHGIKSSGGASTHANLILCADIIPRIETTVKILFASLLIGPFVGEHALYQFDPDREALGWLAQP